MTRESPVTDEARPHTGGRDAPVVDTATGRVRGLWRRTSDGSWSAAFLGLPFAEPPVGDLRFDAPQPKAAWEGVLDCTAYGPTAQRGGDPETQGIPEPSIPGESTLNVNVFTPAARPTSTATTPALPVVVWIHGGGFTAGSPASPWYDGRAFNRDGVVTVTISYRLGFDGFGWIPGAPHNRGVLDWLLALEWVRANVAAFGGDPTRVTIAGQSAGGGAVLTLLGMPAAQHLFRAALCISGATADVSPARAEAYAHRLAAVAGVEATLDGFRSVSEEQLLAAQQKPAKGRGRRDPFAGVRVVLDQGLPLGPTVDGDLVPYSAIGSIGSGVGSDKPLLLGATDDEFASALIGYRRVLRFVPTSFMLDRLGMARRPRAAYRAGNVGATGPGTVAAVGRYITDMVFRVPVVRVATARDASPTWVYRFARRSPASGLAVHCADVPYWFDCLDADRVERLTSAPPQRLADEMHAAAVRFVTDGDTAWPAWSPATGEAMVFDEPSSVVEHAYRDVEVLVSAPT